MATTKIKRTRRVKSAGSPKPSGPACGHSGCGTSCNVRYCGPTSPMHNHFLVHTARGVTHIWTAAIVAGLAVVITGAIAYTAVHAQEVQNDPTILTLLSLRRIEMRLDRMEPKLNYLYNQARISSVTNGLPGTVQSTAKQKVSTSTDGSQIDGSQKAPVFVPNRTIHREVPSSTR